MESSVSHLNKMQFDECAHLFESTAVEFGPAMIECDSHSLLVVDDGSNQTAFNQWN